MADDFLRHVDDVFATVRARRTPRQRTPRRPDRTEGRAVVHVIVERDDEVTEPLVDLMWGRFSWIEGFIAVQFLCGALVFVPGAQQYRGVVRALPFIVSLGMLVLYALRPRTQSSRAPAGTGLLVCALLLYTLNLLHPTSQLYAGVAQCVFQLSIAAPLFWAHKAVRSPALVERLLVLIFVFNLLSASLGVLQVYFPSTFMPPEFSSLGLQLNQFYVSSLTYIGNDGRVIIRPPGLSDLPGGAAMAGATTAILGLGLLLRRRSAIQVGAILAAITIGFAAIYFTQVRSILLATIGAGGLLALVAFRRGRLLGASSIVLVGGAIVFASFVWATSVGGSSVSSRFSTVQGTAALDTYRDGRGGFVSQTVGEFLDTYPLGAGLGRWGMMNVYFGQSDLGAAPLYVEIQLTGWLLDGGVLMWFLYGGAVLTAMWSTYVLTGAKHGMLADVAIVVLALEAYIAALTLGSPPFNTQLGVLFWTLVGAIQGATLLQGDVEGKLHS